MLPEEGYSSGQMWQRLPMWARSSTISSLNTNTEFRSMTRATERCMYVLPEEGYSSRQMWQRLPMWASSSTISSLPTNTEFRPYTLVIMNRATERCMCMLPEEGYSSRQMWQRLPMWARSSIISSLHTTTEFRSMTRATERCMYAA